MKPTILIVEDDDELQELYAAMLEALDYEIETARDGAEALDRLAVVDPDLIVLDILLDRMMGDEFYRRLRQVPRHRQTPVVVVSVLPKERCTEMLGTDAWTVFLRKPFQKREFVEAVQRGLGTRARDERG
ncbi:MAG: response regulator [Anaerolineae bacterium]|nr:response regulator [Anaerolineae bacterium]